MNTITKVVLSSVVGMVFMSGCAQKVQIKALVPAEVGAMASKKKVAVNQFRNDSVGLSGKIESQIAKHELDREKYFTVLSRKDIDKIIAEQKLQSSELMDGSTSAKVGKMVGAQAMINGEIASATAESGSYKDPRKECLSYYKDGGCAQWRYYEVTCNTTQAAVAANLNIVNVETGSIIYGDTISKTYSGDSCKAGTTNLGLMVLKGEPESILSKGQALDKLASDIASEFTYKLTPHYVHFRVTLIDALDVEDASDEQVKKFESALEYIKAGRMNKAEKILTALSDEFEGKSYVVAYDVGVVYEALGQFDKAKKLYAMADELTVEPNEEINAGILRIDDLIAKREEAKKQMNAK